MSKEMLKEREIAVKEGNVAPLRLYAASYSSAVSNVTGYP